MKYTDKDYVLLISMVYMSLFLASLTVGYRFVAFGNQLYCGSVFIFPLLFNISDVVAELYGRKLAENLTWFTLICEGLFVLTTNIVIKMPHPITWHHQADYNYIVGSYPRILVADVVAITTSFYVNVRLISQWKALWQGKFFFLRSIGATAIGEAVFTIITNFIAFSAVVANFDIMKIVIFDYLFKFIYSLIAAYPLSILVAFMKMRRNNHDINNLHSNPIQAIQSANVLSFTGFAKKPDQKIPN